LHESRNFAPDHFLWSIANGVATITLNRPERKNPLRFESYAELGELTYAPTVKAASLVRPDMLGNAICFKLKISAAGTDAMPIRGSF
jgi:hypothetical protein